MAAIYGANKDEFVTSMASLILYDGGAEITSDNIKALLDGSNNKVAPYWPGLFAGLLKGGNVDKLVNSLVTRNIGFFLTDLTHILFYHHNEQLKHLSASQEDSRQVSKLRKSNHDTEHPASSNSSQVKSLSKTSSPHNNQASPTLAPTSSLLSASVPPLKIDFAAFLDAKGHYVGFCSGCEKWHTGVMYLTRKSAEEPNSCLKAWAKVLGSGMYDTDQESLDFTENNGSCPHAVSIPSRHLLFAKDYIAMMFTSGQTFIHLTAVNHKEDQDYFYREIVVPRPLPLPRQAYKFVKKDRVFVL
eukprot:gene10847-7715_t